MREEVKIIDTCMRPKIFLNFFIKKGVEFYPFTEIFSFILSTLYFNFKSVSSNDLIRAFSARTKRIATYEISM